MFISLPVALLLLPVIRSVYASIGDRSNVYSNCKQQCIHAKCQRASMDESLTSLWNPQYNWLVWDCRAECGYKCMWDAVDIFQKQGYNVPQFFGKWPFIRVLGVQEPASMIFSILNGLAHVICIRAFHSRISSNAPMYYVWHLYALVALNTWFWSAMFHTRDVDYTEKMDYFCATSLVAFQLFGLFARLLVFKPRIYLQLVSVIIGSLCVHHLYHMGYVHFDYGYHMKVNITLGIINALGWISWCALVYKKQPYTWRCWTSILLVGACLSLEVLDFPPFLWIFDAHSLWHAGTVPLTFLWYQFIADDCNHLLGRKLKELKAPLYKE